MLKRREYGKIMRVEEVKKRGNIVTGVITALWHTIFEDKHCSSNSREE